MNPTGILGTELPRNSARSESDKRSGGLKVCLVCIRPRDTCYPLSVLHLKAYVNRELPDTIVRIVDAGFEEPLQAIVDSRCDIVGISATSADYEQATSLAKALKLRLGGEFPVIIGGVHITTLPQSLRSCFTLGVRGEGEKPLCELIRLYRAEGEFKPERLSGIPGLVYREGPDLRQNPIEPGGSELGNSSG